MPALNRGIRVSIGSLPVAHPRGTEVPVPSGRTAGIIRKNCPTGPHDIFHILERTGSTSNPTYSIDGSVELFKAWAPRHGHRSFEFQSGYLMTHWPYERVLELLKAWNVPQNYKPCPPGDDGFRTDPPVQLPPISHEDYQRMKRAQPKPIPSREIYGQYDDRPGLY